MSLTVFFLCAGFGSRLAPFTQRVPKPLIPFLGRSALRRNWEKVLALQPQRVICNAHHLPDAIHAEAKELGIKVYCEETILGTGGCLVPVSDMLAETDFFLVHNGDILHSIDLQSFISRGEKQYIQSQGKTLGILSGVDIPAINSLSIKQDKGDKPMFLQGIHGYEGYTSPKDTLRRTYSGIAFYHRDFLPFTKSYAKRISNPEFDIKPIWKQTLTTHNIAVEDHSKENWFDFGTPQGLWEAYKWIVEGERSPPHPYIINEAHWKGLSLKSSNVIILEEPSEILLRSLQSGTKHPQESDWKIDYCILGRDFKWKIKKEPD